MKRIGLMIALSFTCAAASANTCDINLINNEGEVFDTFVSSSESLEGACNMAVQDCEASAMNDFDNIENMLCEQSLSDEKSIDLRYCTVRLTGPFGRFVLGRYSAYGFNACRNALRRCQHDAYRRRGVTRCVIERHYDGRGRRDDRGRGRGWGGRRG